MTAFPARRSALLALCLSLPGGAALAQACPDWSGQGQQLTYSMNNLVPAQTVPVVAGGNVDLSACPIPGGANGYVITSPDFDLTLTDNAEGRGLILAVEGTCDTVLLVNDAGGTWHFNDDAAESLNPEVYIENAPAGAYDIWVGTYGPQTCDAVLVLESVGTGEDGFQILPDPGNMMGYRGQVGTVLVFELVGSTGGAVWGSGVYTDDSSVATAAVHAGVLAPGESGLVTIEVLGGQPTYPGTASNGVTSSNYGSWDGSFQFLDIEGNPVVVGGSGGGASK